MAVEFRLSEAGDILRATFFSKYSAQIPLKVVIVATNKLLHPHVLFQEPIDWRGYPDKRIVPLH